MKFQDLVKKLSGTVILIAEIVMLIQSAPLLSLEILPEYHRWSARLTFGLIAAFSIVSVLIYLFCVLKGKATALLVIWAGVLLFLANTLYASPASLQIILVIALMVYMLYDGLSGSPALSSAVLGAFVICVLVSAFLTPFVTRIEKPRLYTTLENFWWDLYETRSEESGPGSLPRDVIGTNNEGGIPDNVITNDPFPEDDDTPICDIKATYPLGMLYLFSCGDYDPDTFSFSIWNELAELPDQSSPSANYYKNALGAAADLSGKAVILDLRRNPTMMIVPYCAFTLRSEGAMSFADRFIYRNSPGSSISSQFTFAPEQRYSAGSSGYSNEVRSEYLSVPQDFEKDIRQFLTSRGILANDPDTGKKVAAVRELLAAEYTYSNTPPALPAGEDPVMWFLTDSKTGYSKHFAAAEVFLYRSLGIPARYSFGYSVREYNDGAASVYRYDGLAFCEVYAGGAWMLPEDVRPDGESSADHTAEPKTAPVVTESDDPVLLANGYDISHLKGTASMLGAYDDARNSMISRNARDEDATVVLVVDTDFDTDYIKAYSTGEYNYPDGSFTILSDTYTAPAFEEEKDFGQYARGAFMGTGPAGGEMKTAPGFRVFNLFAPKYVYAPYLTVSTDGLSGETQVSYGMEADRMIIPLTEGFLYDDCTVFEGNDPAGPNEAYTKYALDTYTQVPDELLYELREFLEENDIDADAPDKGALLAAVRSLLGSYTYTTQIETIPDGEDPVLWFLTVSRRGYCSHFASAGTLLLRTCGIPARVASGYYKEISAGSIAEITAEDAHTWAEVYDGAGWQTVEMCVGRPAEGQTLPAPLGSEDTAYVLPSAAQRGKEDWRLPSWILYVLLAAAACALIAALLTFIRKNRPDLRQKASIQYRYIRKYYFIDENTTRLLNKVTYSREGVQPEDVKALGGLVSDARSLLLYRHRYLRFVISMIVYAFWHLGAVAENAFSRRTGSSSSRHSN